MKFGVNTYIWGSTFGRPISTLLPRLAASGFDGIEVPILDPAAVRGGRVGPRDAIASAWRGRPSPTCPAARAWPRRTPGIASAPAITSPRASRWPRDLGRRGPGRADVHAGRVPDRHAADARGMEVGRSTAGSSWRSVVEAAGIEIGIEPLNRFETYFLNTPRRRGALCDEIGSPRIGILVDTFHANIEEKSIERGAAPAGRTSSTCTSARTTAAFPARARGLGRVLQHRGRRSATTAG
jgi:D-psicose/D-tagatose/L-ribulose 3-epimerase